MRMPFWEVAMPRLSDIQRMFADAVYDGRPRAVAEALTPGSAALRSLALYRRLIRDNFTEVLRITYPILFRLVGRRYFEAVARGYFRTHPSKSGDLFPYGRMFPDFLRASQAPRLVAELARLEWACHEVHQAADSAPFSFDQIRALASGEPSHVTVRFHAASRLLSFPIPVHRVWQALQPDASTGEVIDLPLPEQETGVVVTRGDGKVRVTPVSRRDYSLLEAMSRGADLAWVERMAVATEPDYDFSRFIATVLSLDVVAGFSIEGQS